MNKIFSLVLATGVLLASIFCSLPARAVDVYLSGNFLNFAAPVYVPGVGVPGNSTTFGIVNLDTNYLYWSTEAGTVGSQQTPVPYGGIEIKNPLNCPITTFTLTCQQVFTNGYAGGGASNVLQTVVGQAGQVILDFAVIQDGPSKQAGVVSITNSTSTLTLPACAGVATNLFFFTPTTNFLGAEYANLYDIRQNSTNYLEVIQLRRGGWYLKQ